MSKKIANTKRSGLSVARVDRNRLDTLYYQLIELVHESDLGENYESSLPNQKTFQVKIRSTGTLISRAMPFR